MLVSQQGCLSAADTKLHSRCRVADKVTAGRQGSELLAGMPEGGTDGHQHES